jgi:hypothetical protein
MDYSNRNFVIFSASELDKIDFNQILEDSHETIRKSLDGTLVLMKYDGDVPGFLSDMTTIVGTYTYDEILPILGTSVWNVVI